MPPYPGFVSGTYRAKSPVSVAERTVNWYVEPLPGAGKNAAALFTIPGETVFSVGTTGVGRGLFEVGGRVFGVFGDVLEEIFQDGGRTTRMTQLAVDGAQVPVLHNTDGGDTLFVAAGGVLRAMVLATNAVTVVNVGATAHDAAMADGYVLALDRSDSSVLQSNKYSSVFTGAYFQRAAASDRWVAIARHGREVWVFGERTSEVWANDGGFPLAFAAVPSARIPHGIAAPWSRCSTAVGLFWLSQTEQGTGEVVLAQGLSAVVVSDFSFAQQVQAYTRIDDAVGWVYQDGGHTWYVLEFPEQGATWTFDLVTRVWAERGQWSSAEGRYRAWRPRHHVYAFGRHLCQDGTTGNLLALTHATARHASGEMIRCYREAPAVFNEKKFLFYSRLEVHVESGRGASSGDGVDPQMELLTSKNDGRTWASQGTRSLGKQGEYGASPVWRRLGRGDSFKAAIVVTEPMPTQVIDAYLEAGA